MEDLFIYFSKTLDNAVMPSKRPEDSGYDFYSCFEEESIRLEPGEIRLIPTGICTAFSKNFVLFVKERSSTGAIGLATRMGVIDSGYRGEIIVALNNTSNKPIVIDKSISTVIKNEPVTKYPYSKAIAQGVFCEVAPISAVELPLTDIRAIGSERGVSFMGASGK